MFAFAHTLFAPSMALALVILGFQLFLNPCVEKLGRARDQGGAWQALALLAGKNVPMSYFAGYE